MLVQYEGVGRGYKKVIAFVNPHTGLIDAQITGNKKFVVYLWTPEYMDGYNPETGDMPGSFRRLTGASARSVATKLWGLHNEYKEAISRKENTAF